MSYIDTMREYAERFNAEAKKSAKALRKEAYRKRERERNRRYRQEHKDEIREYYRKWKKRTGFDGTAYAREYRKRRRNAA